MIELRAGPARAVVVPTAGGRIGSLTVDSTELLVTGRPSDLGPMWGSFPMVPWAGRLAGARFTHDGTTHRLPADLPPHALHGTAFAQSWTVTSASSANASLRCPLGEPWPLGGAADQHLELTAQALRCTLRVTATDRSMPAEVGWHPWFATRDAITVHAAEMYERGPDGIPTGRRVRPSGPPWDDCFVSTRPVSFAVGPLTVAVSSDCDHVVVFDGLDQGTAVEPQSGPPDTFHLRPRILAPGESLQRTMTIAWHARAPTGW